MAHSIIIMRQKLDALRGNATTGTLTTLRTAVDAVQAKIEASQLDLEDEHEKMEEVQTWLVSGGSFAGAAPQAVAFTDALNSFL